MDKGSKFYFRWQNLGSNQWCGNGFAISASVIGNI